MIIQLAFARFIVGRPGSPQVPENRSAGISPDYVGWYESAGRGRVAVSMHPNGMEAAAGALRLLLVPRGKISSPPTTRLFPAHRSLSSSAATQWARLTPSSFARSLS